MMLICVSREPIDGELNDFTYGKSYEFTDTADWRDTNSFILTSDSGKLQVVKSQGYEAEVLSVEYRNGVPHRHIKYVLKPRFLPIQDWRENQINSVFSEGK